MLFNCKGIVNQFAFYPDTQDILPVESLPPGVREIYIETEDKERLQCYQVLDYQSNCLLIFFHGNAGNMGHRLSDILRLNKFGINILGVDYRGYGKSTGKPSEEGIYLDGQAAYKYATKQLGFPSKNIFILGRSIGTAVAIQISQGKELAGLILVSPLTSGKAHAKAHGFGLFAFIAGDSFNNISKVPNIISPLLVIHGEKDKIIPFSMGKEIFQKAEGNKKFVSIERAGHNNLSTVGSRKYWGAIEKFVQQHDCL
jgi:fermentation-respiration switch protein FrsA (DUF1100 family)